MAIVDEGLVNLARFVASLATATGALQTIGDHLEQATRRFSELEDEAEQEGGGLNDGLEELGSALESGQHEAADGLGDVAQAATDGQESASDARQAVEQAATDGEARTQAVLSDLDQAHAELTAQGFQALGQTLHDSEQELEAEHQEVEQSLADLDTAVRGFENEARASWDAAETELEGASADLAQDETLLEAAANEGVHGFQTEGDALETFCGELESDVDLIYDALDAGVESQGNEWEQEVQRISHEAVDFVEAAGQQRMEQPARLVEDEALAALSREYTAVGAVLDGATETAGELEPLAEELGKCQVVVGQIDELMKAVAE